MSNSTNNSDTQGSQELSLEIEQMPEPDWDNPANTRVKIDSLSDFREQASSLFKLARRKIQIYSDNIDPRILNNREVELIFSQFVRSSRNARIEILIKDERNLQGLDHRLVNIAQRFTSYISIKVIPKDFHENYFGFYLVDGKSMIYRSNCERFEAELLHLPNSQLKQKSKYFDEVWQLSTPAIHLRALII